MSFKMCFILHNFNSYYKKENSIWRLSKIGILSQAKLLLRSSPTSNFFHAFKYIASLLLSLQCIVGKKYTCNKRKCKPSSIIYSANVSFITRLIFWYQTKETLTNNINHTRNEKKKVNEHLEDRQLPETNNKNHIEIYIEIQHNLR